jgi:hypothetical protein
VATPTRDDVWLCLHLYEQRREPELRAARNWLIEFSPKSLKDVLRVIEGGAGADANRYWRQATSYWEMISALMMSGGVSPEGRDLFTRTTREFFVFFAKVEPFLAQLRAATRPTLFQGLEQFCRSIPDYEGTLAFYKKMATQIRDRIARSRKTGGGGKKKRPRKGR